MTDSPVLGFTIASGEVRRDILVPRYYDPLVPKRLGELERTHDLVSVGSLIDAGDLEMRQGNYIGKIHYGTGPYPYIRTSDIANWELRASPKHGVSAEVYETYARKQDVRQGDILLVHEGTYLIGTPCLLTRADTKILYQHHLAKLRVARERRISAPLLMVLLMAPIVQRQIRSKQLTADIIDSIVGRFQEVVLPVPKDPGVRTSLGTEAAATLEGRAWARSCLGVLTKVLGSALRAGSAEPLDHALSTLRGDESGALAFLGARAGFSAFVLDSRDVQKGVLIPRYYDPDTDTAVEELKSSCDLRSIGELARDGIIELETGDEVGKLAYGGGSIPFVRTSDLGNWELKHDPKQLVSTAIYEQYARKQSVEMDDILIVRDGTYLVGTSAMVTKNDLPMLFSGGIYRLRVRDRSRIDPYLLLALLNTDVVQRQIRDKQFTRDVIDTIGRRLEEVRLPIPRNDTLRSRVAEVFRDFVLNRAALLRRASELGRLAETV